MNRSLTKLEIEIRECKRISEEQLENDIDSIMETCSNMILNLEEDTRDEITLLRRESEEDLMIEIDEIMKTWND
jgi:hypothetical protein